MKAGEIWGADTDGNPATHEHTYKLTREAEHPVDKSVKCWLTTDMETGEPRLWPVDAFGKELTKVKA
jgi:hypothetical protein